MNTKSRVISRRIGRFIGDRRVIALLIAIAIVVTGRTWLAEHPQHNPFAPLDLRDTPGWATQMKLANLRNDGEACYATLERSAVAFEELPFRTETPDAPECAFPRRVGIDALNLSPSDPTATCAVMAGMEMWRRHSLAPAAEEIFGQEVTRIEHLGTYSCRRMYGSSDGPWSEHATGNAIDIAAFVLADGRRIGVLGDWNGDEDAQRFLRRIRDGACDVFGTVLSPDYNAAHADHFHFDQAMRVGGVCR